MIFLCGEYLLTIRAGALYVLWLLFFSVSPLRVPAQYRVINIPELKQKIKEAKSDSALTRLYGILGWELRFADHKESERLADEMIRIASVSNDHLRLAEAYKIKGFARVIEQELTECLNMYAIAMEHAKKANSGYLQSYILALTAGMYQDKADFDKAIKYYLEALKLAEDYHDAEMTAFISNCLGEVYSDAGRPPTVTLPFYQKAMKLEIELQNWQYVGMICSNIAKDYMLAGNKTEAEKAAKQAIDYIKKKPDRAYVYATVATDIGEVYAGMGKYDEAEKYLAEGLGILDSIGTKDNVLIPLSALAKLYVKRNELVKAEQSANHLVELADRYKTKLFLRDGYKVLSDVAKKRNQPALALQYFEEFTKWNDSIFNENKEKNIANAESRIRLERTNLEIRYETEKKAAENRQLKQSNVGLLNRSFVILLITVALLVLGIVLLLANHIKANKNKELEKQKQIIEKQSREKDTLLREINHRVKNNLQIISSLLNLQANSVTDARAMEALRDSHKRVKAISLIHQKLYGNEDIASIPLEEYINALFADLKMIYGASHIQLICKTEPAGFHLDIESAVPVGLILNETITNALKYAFVNKDAGTLFIEFAESGDDEYTLVVHDDGIGLPENFDPEKSASLGFRIIKELTRQLRGSFQYHTNQGVVFTIRFPNTQARKSMN